MSQNKTYEALKQIGGEGTTSELREYIEEQFPDSSLPEYAVDRLRKLEKKDVVEIDDSSAPYYVRVIDEDWEGIPDSIANRSFPPQSSDE